MAEIVQLPESNGNGMGLTPVFPIGNGGGMFGNGQNTIGDLIGLAIVAVTEAVVIALLVAIIVMGIVTGTSTATKTGKTIPKKECVVPVTAEDDTCN